MDTPDALPHPADPRFGCGPTRVRSAQLQALLAEGSPMGTSHRAEPVKAVVRELRRGIADLYRLPEGWEVVLGNGGASAFWDAIPFCLVEHTAQCCVIGEFSAKAAKAVRRAPWLSAPDIREAAPGSSIAPQADDAVDTYLYVHNETSTGVLNPLWNREGAAKDALVIVDGTSAAGAVEIDVTATDVYYFSLQKAFGADGGLWVALLSPAALARIERLTAERWVPDFLNLQLAVTNSRKDQTLNTPAIATLILAAEQVRWLLDRGGLSAADAHCRALAATLGEWVARCPAAEYFVADPALRSHVVSTIDLTGVDAPALTALLRERGQAVDINGYRGLGRNQIRVGAYPSVEDDDVAALCVALDAAVAELSH